MYLMLHLKKWRNTAVSNLNYDFFQLIQKMQKYFSEELFSYPHSQGRRHSTVPYFSAGILCGPEIMLSRNPLFIYQLNIIGLV